MPTYLATSTVLFVAAATTVITIETAMLAVLTISTATQTLDP